MTLVIFFLSISCAAEGACKDFVLSADHAFFSKLLSIVLILLSVKLVFVDFAYNAS